MRFNLGSLLAHPMGPKCHSWEQKDRISDRPYRCSYGYVVGVNSIGVSTPSDGIRVHANCLINTLAGV